MSTTITCPHCGHVFSLDELQEHTFSEKQKELEAAMHLELTKKEESIKRDMWIKAQAAAEKKSLDENKEKFIELEMLRKQKEESDKKEADFYKQKLELEQLQKNLELEKDKARLEERKRLEEEFTKQAQERVKLELEKQTLENEKRLRAKDEQIEQMKRAIEDAKRKGEQGSMQIQWEVGEWSLKDMLAHIFHGDTFSDVEKGIRWADLIQEVNDAYGHTVGVIAWESKNTKAWSDGWITKLKEDRLRVNASISVLVSAMMPRWVERFWLYEWVWVVDWTYVREVASILRNQLLEIARIENSLEWREERLEVVFHYLTSSKFRDKMENIIDAFRMLHDQVAEERRTFESRWKKREELLERVLKNTSGMYGELSSILGAKLQKVDYLELTTPRDE